MKRPTPMRLATTRDTGKVGLTETSPGIWSGQVAQMFMPPVSERGVAGTKMGSATTSDQVNNPTHYTSHPSGVECIEITEHFPFNTGNAIKYIWRAGLKSDNAIQDLSKALFYIQREINRLEHNAGKQH